MNEEFEQIEAEQEIIAVKKEILLPRVAKKRTVKSGMFGVPEILAVGLGVLSLLAVGLFYLFWVIPANAEVKAHKESQNQLETSLKDEKAKFGNITSTKDRVEQLVNSVDFFERNYLPVAENGRTALYQRVNTLISAYGLVNTTGPDFSPLETVNVKQSQQNEKEKGRNKFQSLFPGVYVSMTLEGSYQSLRRFMRELESSGQFVIISTVELEAAEGSQETKDVAKPKQPKSLIQQPYPRSIEEDVNGIPSGRNGPNLAPQPTPKPTPQFKQPKGKTRGESVSLHLEMAAYFRRDIKSEPAAITQ
jgi:Tfp pilus assembly protein PilO